MKKILVKLSFVLIPAIIFFSTLFVLWSLVSSHSLFHDEAVYLTKARSWIEGTPADEFKIYRPIGMADFGWIFLHFGDSEKTARSFGVIFGAITILFIFLFFRQMFNVWIAISVVLVTETSSLFLQQAPHFLNDIFSSGLLIGVLWLLYIHYETAGKSKSIYFIGPLAALAFYIRYGVASAFGVIGVLSLLILLPRFMKKEGASYSKLGIAFIISIFLFAFHFIQSFIATKSFLGILSISGEAAHRKYLGEGLVDYIKWLPNEIGGWFLGITAITGIIATTIILSRKTLRQNYVSLLWIGSIGLFNFILTGLLVHAEARYVFFPMVLLSGTGIASVYYLIRNQSKIFVNLLMGIFLLITLYYGIASYNETDSFFKRREVDKYHAAYVKASEIIFNDSFGNNGCVVWSVLFRPAISWYSRCNTLEINNVARFEKDFLIHFKKTHYSIVFTKLKEPQINQDKAENFGVILTEIFHTKNLAPDIGELIVYRITRKDTREEDYLNLLEK